MKLYECNRNVKVRIIVEEQPPPDGIPPKQGKEYMFHHIDGMYSYCTDENKNVVHLKAWTEVELVQESS